MHFRSGETRREHGREASCDFAVLMGGQDAVMDAGRFAELVRQRQQPTLLVNATGAWAGLRDWMPFDSFSKRYGWLQLPVRRPSTTARGQSFRRANKFVTVEGWGQRLAAGQGPPLVFDTNGSSGLLASFRPDISPLPAGLATVLRMPVFSLADGSAPAGRSGLAFHHHDESWLALLTGLKTWFVPVASGGRGAPVSAYHRRPLAELEALRRRPGQHSTADQALLRCEQRPGDVVYLPAGTYHATYSSSSGSSTAAGPGEQNGAGAVIGIGGMGDSTVAIGYAVAGDLEGLAALALRNSTSLLRTNAHGELPTHRAATAEVLGWLAAEGSVPLDQPTGQEGGAQLPVHAAAMRGDIEALALLDRHGMDLRAVASGSGQQPTHFAAAGRSLAALAWLHDAGSDIHASSSTGQQPLHLAALAGDTAMLSWLVEHGVSINTARLTDGATASHFAAHGGTADPETALLALMWLDQNGADLQAKTQTGQTPSDLLSLWAGQGPARAERLVEKLAAQDEAFGAWWRGRGRSAFIGLQERELW